MASTVPAHLSTSRACRLALSLLVLLASTAISLVSATPGSAQGTPARRVGTLDRAFAGTGKAFRDFGSEPGSGGAKRVIPEADGGVLVLTTDDSIVRLLPDGSLDSSFGEGGYVTADEYGADALALAPDGRIVSTGEPRTVPGAPVEIEVNRYLPDGRPDPDFGRGGTAVLTGPPQSTGGEGVVVEPSGKVIVLTRVITNKSSAVAAIRLTAKGALDGSYGRSGVATAVTPGKTYAAFVNGELLPRCYALSEGRLTVALGGEGKVLLARFGPSGRLDPEFGSGGEATAAVMEGVMALAIDAQGREIVTGEAGRVARFLPDGSLDPSFGSGGVAAIPALQETTLSAVELKPDGTILLGGDQHEHLSATPEGFLVARLGTDGAPDQGFGEGGVVVTRFGSEARGEAGDLSGLGDGRLLLAGTVVPQAPVNGRDQVGVVRYLPGGSVDPGFGSQGIDVFRPRAQAADSLAAAVSVGAGRTVVVGRGGGGAIVARYRSNGRLDGGFGRGGIAAPVSVSGDYFGEGATSVARESGGRFLVGTASHSGGGILRYLPNGRLDPSFGAGGIVHTAPFDGVLALAAAPGGDIVAAGISYDECRLVLARFRPDGALDTAFGGGSGSLQISRGAGPCHPHAVRVAVRPNGNTVVAGSWQYNFVVEVTSGGAIDRGFGRHGRSGVLRVIPDRVRALALDSRGRILVGGTEHKRLQVTRLTSDGYLDRSFGRGGTATTALGKQAEATALALAPDGDVVVAGSAKRQCGAGPECVIAVPLVARYLPDGAPDRGFGRRGVWSAQVGTAANISALAIGPRSITAAGWAARPGTARDALVLRLSG